MSLISKVGNIYEAFGRGDLEAILSYLSDDIEWEYGGTEEIPWLAPRQGRSEVPKFFQTLAAQVDFSRFQPKTFFEAANTVLVLVDFNATAKATGRKFSEEDEVHIWRFNDQGKVARFRHRADTLRHWRAVQA